MFRVATWAKTIRPKATIQVTTIELVIGKPNGRAISMALCERPCSAASGRGRERVADGADDKRGGEHPKSRAALAVSRCPRRPRGATPFDPCGEHPHILT